MKLEDKYLNGIVVCMPFSPDNPFDDNEQGPCAECGREIMWRPHNPPLPKVCLHCVAKALEDGGIEKPDMRITEETMREFREHSGKPH